MSTISVSELVHFTGQLHLVSKFSPTDPCRLFTNVISVQGVGSSTGLSYQIAGAFQSEQSVTAGSTFEFQHAYILVPPNPVVPPNPITPVDPCRIRYTLSLDNTGAVTQATAFALPIGIPGDH